MCTKVRRATTNGGYPGGRRTGRRYTADGHINNRIIHTTPVQLPQALHDKVVLDARNVVFFQVALVGIR
jgi:hypothetical protein